MSSASSSPSSSSSSSPKSPAPEAKGDCWLTLTKFFRNSRQCSVGKLNWQISMSPSEDDGGFRIFVLFDKENATKLWKLDVEVTLSFYLDTVKRHIEKRTLNFSEENLGYNFDYPKELVDRIWPDLEGFANMKATIRVKETVGLRRRMALVHDFTQLCDMWNLMLIVDKTKKKVFVDVNFLAHYSSFFSELKYLIRKDGLKKDLVTKIPYQAFDVDYNAFLTILRILYQESPPITVKNVEEVMKTAEYLKIDTVLVKCEDFLLKDPEAFYFSSCQKLEWSVVYQMSDLQEKCLQELNSLKVLRSDPFYKKISKDAKELILDQIVCDM